MKVILISGKARHGKDTVAEILKNRLISDDKTVLLTHYADLLKFICQNIFGWNGKKDEAGRRMLQYVGTDIIRTQNPDFWVDFIATILKYFPQTWDYVIIPDCRFPNEVTKMTEHGFDVTLLKVVRPNFENHLTAEQQRHPSETALDGTSPDYCIENIGTLAELEAATLTWIKEKLYEH